VKIILMDKTCIDHRAYSLQ